jgi:hypothetical protein
MISLIPEAIDHVMPHYLGQGSGLVKSVGMLWEIFRDITANNTLLDGIYLVVDALDECDDTSRKSLLRYFLDFFNSGFPDGSNSPFIKILATSRPYQDIEQLLQQRSLFLIRLKTENNEENINKDIEAFVSHEIDKLRTDTNTHYDNLLLEDIRNTLIARADGMFLLVSLIVEDLKTTPTDQIRGKLQIIPSSLGGFY